MAITISQQKAPTAVGYLSAAIGAAIIMLLIMAAIILRAELISRHYLLKFSADIVHRRYAQALSVLPDIGESRLSQLLGTLAGGSQTPAKIRQEAVGEISKIMLLLDSNQYLEAAERFAALRNRGLDRILLESLETDTVNSRIARIEGTFKLLRESSHREADIDRQINQQLELLQRIGSEQLTLAAEVSRFFSLEPEQQTTENTTPQLYTTGILKDIPRVPSLPDSINSGSELKINLDRAGGRLSPEVFNSFELFTQQIARFRDRSRALDIRSNQLKKQINNLRDTAEQLGATLSTSARQLHTDLSKTAVDGAKYKHSQPSQLVNELLEKYLTA